MVSSPCARTASHSPATGTRTTSRFSPRAGRCGWCSATPPPRGSARPARWAATWARSSPELRQRTGRRWRVLNLSLSGALIRDVLHDQLPRLPVAPDLVTCGVGANDILYSAPAKLLARPARADRRRPGPARSCSTCRCPPGSGASSAGPACPYVARINRTIHRAAAARGLPVAEVSAHYLPPWNGKLSVRLLPPQPGRLPRLGARAARRHPVSRLTSAPRFRPAATVGIASALATNVPLGRLLPPNGIFTRRRRSGGDGQDDR